MKTNRLLATTPLALVSTLLCFGQSSSAPASSLDRFAGDWILNEAKSTPTGPKLAFRLSADGGMEQVSGVLVTAIHLDGKPYDTRTPGTTEVWEQRGPNQFEYRTLREGKVTATRSFEISDAGKILTVQYSTGTSYTYSRSSGEGPGLAGTWDVQSAHVPNRMPMTWSVAGPKSLYVSGMSGGPLSSGVVVLDDKPVSALTPAQAASAATAAAAGNVSAAAALSQKAAWKQIDDHTIAETTSRDGVVSGTDSYKRSDDGKSMTVTSTPVSAPDGTNAGNGAPRVTVYDRRVISPSPRAPGLNLSGAWKLNMELSHLSNGKPIPYYTEFILRIDHAEPKIRIEEKITSAAGSRGSTFEFATNGKESYRTAGDPASIYGVWEGDTLVTRVASGASTTVRKYKMAADGKSITADWAVNNGSTTATEVWEKQ
jgi:hypothetical protein